MKTTLTRMVAHLLVIAALCAPALPASAFGGYIPSFSDETMKFLNDVAQSPLVDWSAHSLPAHLQTELENAWDKLIKPVVIPITGGEVELSLSVGRKGADDPYHLLFRCYGRTDELVRLNTVFNPTSGSYSGTWPARSILVEVYFTSQKDYECINPGRLDLKNEEDRRELQEIGSMKFKTDFVSLDIGDRGRLKIRYDLKNASVVHATLAWKQDNVYVELQMVSETGASGAVDFAREVDDALRQAGVYDFPSPASDPQTKVTAKPARFFDANPIFYDNNRVERLDASQLANLPAASTRIGTVADGVSNLLVRAEFSMPGRVSARVVGEGNGTCTALTGGATQEIDGVPCAFAVYEPPPSFGPSSEDAAFLQSQVETRDVTIELELSASESGERLVARETLKLARPPVVLVHGTFDDPKNCWEQKSHHSPLSMLEALQQAGFYVSLCDFQNTNGKSVSSDSWTGAVGLDSSFDANKMVVWSNPGGILEALTYFRETLKIAATQADVVGHSLGGVLPRVYASDNYKKDHTYARHANYGHGDIHRLITIGSPHYGSELSQLLLTLENASIAEVSFKEFVAAKTFAGLADWFEHLAATGAVIDQLPKKPPSADAAESSWLWGRQGTGPTALERIGPTPIPAHAIVCISEDEDIRDFDGAYHQRFITLCQAFFYNPGLLQKYFRDLGQERHGEILIEAIETKNFLRSFNEGWLGAVSRTGDPTSDIGVPPHEQDDLLRLFRASAFGFCDNDCTVRVESQRGGLEKPHVTVIPHVLHSFAPRYESVQQAVIRLLEEDSRFSPDGFGPAGKPLACNEPPDTIETGVLAGDAAKARSGMVNAHMDAFSMVARELDQLILVRPVNPDATTLIERGAATKGMHIKGKSSDWGPQRGYIPVNQRFSKLGNPNGARDQTKIDTFDQLVQECIDEGYAVARPLRVEDRAVRTFLLAGAPEDAFPLVLVEGENGQWHDPAANKTYIRDELAGEGEPLCVLARPDAPHHYLTADYDLLAVGIREEVRGAGDVKWPPFHPDMGGITERQKETLLALNEAVETHAHYASGNVVHHGPENQYEKSDYVDYPVTVFEPDGRILVILQGPENHRDLHLKRYFARKQRSGWYVYYNEKSPGWQWEHYRPYDPIKGYDDRDAPNLPPFPDELPPPDKPKVAMAQEPGPQVPMPDRPVQRAESSQEDGNAPEEASATTVRNEEQQGAASENAPAGREPGVSVQVWEPLNSRKKTEKKPKPAPAEEEGASRREPGIKVEVFDPLSSSEEETDSSGSAVEKTKPRKKSN